MVANLTLCLEVFNRKVGMLNASELRLKSMLAAIRNELERSVEMQSEREA